MLMGQKKTDDAEAKKAEVRDIGDQISKLDNQTSLADAELRATLLRLPHLPHGDVPIGASEEDNREIRQWGEKPNHDFEPKPPTDLCESLGLVDFARGAKLAGSGFLLYSGWGARLGAPSWPPWGAATRGRTFRRHSRMHIPRCRRRPKASELSKTLTCGPG